MSDKIFINFTKYTYDECLRRLKSEIDSYMTANGDPNETVQSLGVGGQGTSSAAAPDNQQSARSEVLAWTDEQVRQWLNENNINYRIVEDFYPCTGQVLKQLYEMRHDAPEFYFQSLGKNKSDLKQVLDFTNLLKKLFD